MSNEPGRHRAIDPSPSQPPMLPNLTLSIPKCLSLVRLHRLKFEARGQLHISSRKIPPRLNFGHHHPISTQPTPLHSTGEVTKTANPRAKLRPRPPRNRNRRCRPQTNNKKTAASRSVTEEPSVDAMSELKLSPLPADSRALLCERLHHRPGRKRQHKSGCCHHWPLSLA
jgi:hypothetical protein